MGATFSRLKNWIAEVLSYADLNAEIDNILTNLTPSGMDDYSTTATEMRITTDPGESGTESLATSLRGELERIRFAIKEIKGSYSTYWYSTANTSLTELLAALGGTAATSNRINSGRSSALSSQPLFLVPHGTNRTCSVQGASTTFNYTIAGTVYTMTTAVTSGTLSAAPSTNNTCLVNDATLTGQAFTKQLGEFDTAITVDNMGSELTALTGKLCGFKTSTEYFIAKVDSTTQLTKAFRGYFFDSADAYLSRVALSDNDTITLMKLTWVFATTTGTLTTTYTNPRVGKDEPTAPAADDYWFDTVNAVWKIYSSGAWVTANAILIGICLQDTTGTKAARSFDYFKGYTDDNSVEIERISNTEIRSKLRSATLNVYGAVVKYQEDFTRWDITADLVSGVTEAASTTYYCYVTESGESYIDNRAPHDRTDDRRGYYHPFEAWRCVGEFFNNASSNISGVNDYKSYTRGNASGRNYAIVPSVASNNLTVAITNINGDPITPTLPIRLDFPDVTNGKVNARILRRPLSITVASGGSLGNTNAIAAYQWLYFMDDAGVLDIGISTNPLVDIGATQASTLVSAGATSATVLYSSVTHSGSVPVIRAGRLTSTQATAGTWATAPSAVAYDAFPVYAHSAPVAYTATFSSGFGTVGTQNYLWFRDGEFLNVYGYHINGTVGAGLGTMSIPSGININTAYVAIGNTSGNASYNVGQLVGQGGVMSKATILTATGTSTTLVYVGGIHNTTDQTPLQAATNVNSVIYTSGNVSITFRVPIAGWHPYGP